jgi:hypothetical protein
VERNTLAPSDFVGRAAELELLERAFTGRESAFIPVYGRRRIGKSELILQFLRGKPGIYHLGQEAPAALQVRSFLREAARVLDEPLLAEIDGDWGGALDKVVERWRGEKKLVLVFDEFQWTAGASRELPSLLQERWDRRWSRGGRVMLILCGSFIGFMEREVLGKKSPLFGRRTAQIQLRPLSYQEASALHRNWALADRARAYFVCGGVPMYLRAFDRDRSFESNLAAQLLSEYSPLHREPELLLREELRDVQSYQAVLSSIAAGRATTREIAAHSGLPERSLHYYLEQLAQLGYLARRHPLDGGRRRTRIVRFVLDDALLRFWFRFVFPNRGRILQLGPTRALAEVIKPELEGYLGGCFERLCREALAYLYAREGISASFEAGEYWDKQVQIDVVSVRDDRWIDLGECKWGPVGSARAPGEELEAKVARYPNRLGATLGRRLFVRHLPRRAPAGPARWHSLDDLYA